MVDWMQKFKTRDRENAIKQFSIYSLFENKQSIPIVGDFNGTDVGESFVTSYYFEANNWY